MAVYEGVMTFNVVNFYSNGSKKRFDGYILLKDTNQNEASYKILSFRSQPIIQSEVIGERGMQGKSVIVHGEFKENTWNGKTTQQLYCEKLYIVGMEQLAADAEASALSLPAVPAGSLPNQGNHIVHVGVPVIPVPVIPDMKLPSPVQGGYVAPNIPLTNTGPSPVQGGYVAPNIPLTNTGPSPVQVKKVAPPPKPRKPRYNVPEKREVSVAVIQDYDD